MRRRTIVLVFGTATLLVSLTAFAEPQAGVPTATAGRVQVQVGLSYGSDNLEVGLTARAGYTLPMGVHVGALIDYFFETTDLMAPGGTSKLSAWNLGVEAGYDFGLGPAIVLRPFVGSGNIHGSTTFCSILGGSDACQESSSNDFFLELGGAANYVGQRFFGGADVRMIASDEAMWIVGGHVGLVF
jgi:hypothetical protein